MPTSWPFSGIADLLGQREEQEEQHLIHLHIQQAMEAERMAMRRRAEQESRARAIQEDINRRYQQIQELQQYMTIPRAFVDQVVQVPVDQTRYARIWSDIEEPKPEVKKIKRNLPDWF